MLSTVARKSDVYGLKPALICAKPSETTESKALLRSAGTFFLSVAVLSEELVQNIGVPCLNTVCWTYSDALLSITELRCR